MQSNLLETRRLVAFYGDFQALFGIDFRIERDETVAMIGSNGAGKSTFLKSISGLVRAEAEAIYFDGEAIGGDAAGNSADVGQVRTALRERLSRR